MWMLPLYLHVNQKSNYNDDILVGTYIRSSKSVTCKKHNCCVLFSSAEPKAHDELL